MKTIKAIHTWAQVVKKGDIGYVAEQDSENDTVQALLDSRYSEGDRRRDPSVWKDLAREDFNLYRIIVEPVL